MLVFEKTLPTYRMDDPYAKMLDHCAGDELGLLMESSL